MLQIVVMTNKDWYVLHQTKKFGPFAKQQILEMLKTGSVMRSQKVWREGLDEPITSYELFLESVGNQNIQKRIAKPQSLPKKEPAEAEEIEEKIEVKEQNQPEADLDDELPPPLPPLPVTEVRVEETESEEVVEEIHELEDEPEEIVIHKEIADFKRLTGQEVAVLPPLPPDIIHKKNKKKNLELMFRKGLILLAGLFLCAVFYVFFHDIYIVHLQSPPRLSIIDIKDDKILKKAASHSPEKLAVSVMSSKDASSLVLVTNFVYDADVSVELVSVEKKVLHRRPVIIKAQSKLYSGQAVFKNLEFQGSDMIHPGYYKVKIVSSNEARNLYWYDRFTKIPQKMVLEDLTTFLGHISLKQFKKKLKRFLNERQRKERQFEGDLKQKWATLDGIVNQLKSELIQMVQAPAQVWKTKVASFEKKYTKIYGSFFTEFYLNNEDVQKKLSKSNVRQLSEFDELYSELSSIAKSVGRQTVKIIERASAFNYAPNQETRADMTSDVIKNTTAFGKRISKGQDELNRLLGLEENVDESEAEDL